jgi:hypothetical protein
VQRFHGQVPDAHGVGAGQDLAAELPGADAPGEPVVGFVEHHDPVAAEAFLALLAGGQKVVPPRGQPVRLDLQLPREFL